MILMKCHIFYYGSPEWLQTRRPHSPFAATQALLPLIMPLHALCFILFFIFLFYFSGDNKQTKNCTFV